MKRVFTISAIVISILFIDSCSKQNDHTSLETNIVLLDQNVLNTTQVYFHNEKGNVNILDELFVSPAWASIPENISSEIILSDGATLANYKNSQGQTISFKLKSNLIYKTLTFYCFNKEFLPVLASAKRIDNKVYLSVTDLNNNPYYDFFVDKNNRMGQFRVHKDLPKFKTANISAGAKNPVDPTCMDKTSNFGDCMLCAIDECAHDWICAIVCSIMSASCLTGFGIGCIID